MKLRELIKQDRFQSAGQEAVLNVLVTASWLNSELSSHMHEHGLTPSQYNVLRILRGSHPDKLTCSGIAERLLDRTPDVTRLLNRLERADYVERTRADHDRRVVEVAITDEGVALLDRMQPKMDAAMQRMTRHLDEDEHRHLSALLERLRTDQ